MRVTLDIPEELAIRISSLGNLYFELKDRVKPANECYQQALKIYREIGDRVGEANVLQELGKLEADRIQALKYLQQAQNLYREIGTRYSESRNLLFIGDVYLDLEQQDDAVKCWHRAAEFATTINYEPLVKAAQRRIAKIDSSANSTNQELG